MIGPTLVVIPTYNEAENIESIAQRVLTAAPACELLVVDDASPDGTGQLADDLAEADERVHVLHRPGKNGLGVAYRDGFAWAVKRGYDAVVEIDADGSHDPAELPAMLERLEDADLVIGTRWIPGGRVENWSAFRAFLSRAGNLYARVTLGMSIRDSTSGYRAFRTSALARIGLEAVASQGYSFQIDLAWRTVRAGLTVAEIPIVFTDREHGVSKMTVSVALESLLRVTGWAIRDRLLGFRRRRSEGRG